MTTAPSPTPFGTVTQRGERFDLSFERIYATSVDDVWDAVSNPERLARWMAPYRGELRLGGRWEALNSDGSVFSWGTVTACEPPRTYATTWEYEGEDTSVVTITVTEHPEGAVLVLRHEHLEDRGYGAGWQTYLEQLDKSLGLAPSAVVDPHRAPDIAWDARYTELEIAWRPRFEALAAEK